MDCLNRQNLQDFVVGTTGEGAIAYTYWNGTYCGLPCPHMAAMYSVREFVHGQGYTYRIESLLAMLKRGCVVVYHQMSIKHLGLHPTEFGFRHSKRSMFTVDQMAAMATSAAGKWLRNQDLVD